MFKPQAGQKPKVLYTSPVRFTPFFYITSGPLFALSHTMKYVATCTTHPLYPSQPRSKATTLEFLTSLYLFSTNFICLVLSTPDNVTTSLPLPPIYVLKGGPKTLGATAHEARTRLVVEYLGMMRCLPNFRRIQDGCWNIQAGVIH